MTNQELKDKILLLLPSAQIAEGKQYLEIEVAPNEINKVAKTLKASEELYFDYLFCQSGVDWKDSLGVIYHLASTKHSQAIVLKTKVTDRVNPSLPTVSDIWRTAEYHEREIYDMMGIRFKNHPDMRRFFLDESWSGYPQRKDYTDEENIISR